MIKCKILILLYIIVFFSVTDKMPELQELQKNLAQARLSEEGQGSGTESDSDDTIPELEEAGGAAGGAGGAFSGPGGLSMDMVSKAKQSRGEKKARKIMSKLGLKPVRNLTRWIHWKSTSTFCRISLM